MQSVELELIIKLKKKLKQEIFQTKLDLESKEHTLQEINSFLKNNCKHNYELDYVSSGLDDIICVEYCSHCEEPP